MLVVDVGAFWGYGVGEGPIELSGCPSRFLFRERFKSGSGRVRSGCSAGDSCVGSEFIMLLILMRVSAGASSCLGVETYTSSGITCEP